MQGCLRCYNQTDFVKFGNYVCCNDCKHVVYERKVNTRKNKLTHLKNILRRFHFFQSYLLEQLYNEIDKNDISLKTVRLFLKKKDITDWVFCYQFLNKLNNINFELSLDDREIIINLFNNYLCFITGNVSYKKVLPMIFKYLNIDFGIKPDYDETFLKFIEILS